MTAAVLDQRPPRPAWFLALAGAVAINMVIFGAAAWLLSGQPERPLLEAYPISAFLPPPAPPPPEAEQEPPPPPPPPKVQKLKPMEAMPQANPQPHVDTPRLELELNPRLALGPAIAAPPPLPVRHAPAVADRAPMPRSQAPPPYPYLARRRGIAGEVQVRFLVGVHGEVRNVEVIAAKPPGYFEDSVLKTVSRWRFAPAIRDGRPVATWVETTVRFKLEGR